MAYIGWPVGVNKIILDSTNVVVGENATIQDSLESGGQKKTRVKCANPPDKYQVTMAFDFVEKDNNGLTELDKFYIWYKWYHCYGSNPFQFPAILLNSNRQESYSTEEVSHGMVPDLEYYTISSAVNGRKSGLSQEVEMTWETYATGVITIEDEEAAIDHIVATNGYVDLVFNQRLLVEPTTSTYTVSINGSVEPITGTVYDGDTVVRYFFTPKTVTGIYTVVVGDKTAVFGV